GVAAHGYGSLFGQHYFPFSNPRYLVGHFNAHLQDAVVLFADEAFPPDDKRAIGMLKEGDCLLLAGKGHETYQVIGTDRSPFDEREIVADILGGRAAS
ncbi:MAG: hypothetical protein IH798_02510, partial [Gemmatimonadetes bacterium]|nr:hypothetical protein [Gemmatimonadota bacterium]